MDNLHRGSWATGPGAAPYVSRTRIRDNRRNSQLTIRPEREIGWRTVPLEIGSIGPAASATGRARTHPMSARCASSANLRKRWIWCYLRSQSVVGPTGPLFPACHASPRDKCGRRQRRGLRIALPNGLYRRKRPST